MRTSSFTASVLAALYVVECAALLCAMIAYKNGDQPVLSLFVGRYGSVFDAAALGALAAGAYLVWRYRRARRGETRQFWLALAMNAVTVFALLVLGETAVRLFSTRAPSGISVLGFPLLPRSWEDAAARNREFLRTAPTNISYFVPDDLLGWTIGPSRQSRNGLYSSSIEGIRSARPGVAYAAASGPLRRVALVGDSFTFGLEVPFEESWAYRLQQELGAGVQILNFGVDGYGVDQAYLRYRRDVRPWRPDLVVFGFINHDLYRSMAVYSFVSFPEWEFPFGKPRFVLNAGKLNLFNTPVLTPQEIVTRRSIAELPFIELDRGYEPSDWQWHPYYHSQLARFLLSRFRRWPEPRGEVSDRVMQAVNTELLASFASLAREQNSTPLIVYFPSRGDYSGQDRRAKDPVLAALRERNIEYQNLTSCLGEVGVSHLFIENRPHYSPQGNAAVAKCLVPAVRARLGDPAASPGRPAAGRGPAPPRRSG